MKQQMKQEPKDMGKPVMKELVIPLADVLQVRLGLHTLTGKEPRIVGLGNTEKGYKLQDVVLSLKCEVKASFVNDRLAAVLMRVRKDLFVYIVYMQTRDELAMLLLDTGKLPMTPQMVNKIDGAHPKQAQEMLMPAIVGKYRKKQAEEIWTRETVDAVGPVDSGQDSKPAEGSSAAA